MGRTKKRTAANTPPGKVVPVTRRALLAGAATLAGGAIVSALPGAAESQEKAAPAAPVIPEDASKVLGPTTSAASIRSPFVKIERTPTGAVSGSSLSPIHQLVGTITPNDLLFERHHAGVAMIDPAKYKLLIHGLVNRPMVFTLADLVSLPSVTRIHFLECSGNGRAAFKGTRPDLSPQLIDGLFSYVEWTGVPVKTVLASVGIKREATWALAEGGDAALMSRSIPVSKLMDDALFVYAANGEPLRPSGGYPVRLLLPGWEGNANVKWLRRLEFLSQPNMSKDETSKYTDPLPDGTARQFSFELDAKSTITWPTFPVRVEKRGWIQIAGLAWSGRGRVTSVDVSTDGGSTWTEAELHAPALAKAAVRFTHLWNWEGAPSIIMSRVTDDTGYTQPTMAAYKAKRGPGTDYHYNHIRAWKVQADGQVFYEVMA